MQKQPNKKAALTVTVVQPEQQNWKQTFTANGNIAAWQEVVIGSELSGQRLTRVNVNVSDEVKRGQVLAEINSDTIRADLAAAKASYAEAQAVLADAVTNNKRIQQLRNTGAISAQELTQYQTSRLHYPSKTGCLRAQIESNQLRLAQTQVISPDNAKFDFSPYRNCRFFGSDWTGTVPPDSGSPSGMACGSYHFSLYKLKQGMNARIFSP